jgi:hypothetical protein
MDWLLSPELVNLPVRAVRWQANPWLSFMRDGWLYHMVALVWPMNFAEKRIMNRVYRYFYHLSRTNFLTL